MNTKILSYWILFYLLKCAIWKLFENTVTKRFLIHKSSPEFCSWLKSTFWSFGVSTCYANGVSMTQGCCVPGVTRQPQHKLKQILSPHNLHRNGYLVFSFIHSKSTAFLPCHLENSTTTLIEAYTFLAVKAIHLKDRQPEDEIQAGHQPPIFLCQYCLRLPSLIHFTLCFSLSATLVE